MTAMAKIAMKAPVAMIAMTLVMATMTVLAVKAFGVARSRPERAPALRPALLRRIRNMSRRNRDPRLPQPHGKIQYNEPSTPNKHTTQMK